MPKYRVLKPGFFGGRLYDPQGKRSVLHTDKPFPKDDDGEEQIPSWLALMTAPVVAEKNPEEILANSTPVAPGSPEAVIPPEEQEAVNDSTKAAEEQQKQIADASFMGEGEQSSAVETL